jgi:hypothetical protein
MNGDLQNDPKEPSKVDITTSEACTRSGTFALAISLVLFALVAPWAHRPSEMALSRYLAYRYDLSSTIERLDDDPNWQKFEGQNAGLESKPLSQLPTQVPVAFSASPAPVKEKPRRHSAAPKTFSPGLRPAAPTLFTVTVFVQVPAVEDLIGVLKKLNDSNVLTGSRAYSRFFDFSIARWAQTREDMIYREAAATGCSKNKPSMVMPYDKNHVPQAFVPTLDTTLMLDCLTLHDVRDLARLEQPPITNPDQIGGNLTREVEIAPGTLPHNIYTASIVLQALLLFVIVYFGSFTREATLSKKFPAQATLFSAFSRSWWTLLAMLLALLTPFAAALTVAIVSGRPLLWVESALILLAVVWIFLLLQQKSYWRRAWRVNDQEACEAD